MQSILEKFKNFLLTLTDDELKLFGLMRYDSNENVSYDMDTLIGITLENLGIPEHIRGTPYLRTAIHLACENPDDLKELMNKLYPEIAKIHNSTTDAIQRHMREAISLGYACGNQVFWEKVFTCSVHSEKLKIPNGYFIKGVTAYILKQMQ